MNLKHPSHVLELNQHSPLIPVCDHYAGSEKLMCKSMLLQQQLGPIFDITFDCEDGASVGTEVEHIAMICRLINSDDNAFNRIGVRVHSVNHASFVNDLHTLIQHAGHRVAYIVIPKINSANDISHAIDSIDYLSNQYGITRLIPVHALIETHTALREVFRIAAHPRLECLSFGLMDFVSAHHGAIDASAMTANGQFEHKLIDRAKTEMAAACHAYNKVPSHNVITEFSDAELVYQAAIKAKKYYGYTRMWSIHPNQIEPITRALLPSHAEVSEAQHIINQAAHHDWAPIKINNPLGQTVLHDRASYRYYWSLLVRAHAQHISIEDDVVKQFLMEE